MNINDDRFCPFMVASKYAKKSTLINITLQKKERKEEKTRSYANVWLSADINSCPTK